jgi:hypothetical protein
MLGDSFKERLIWPFWISVVVYILLQAAFIGVFINNVRVPHSWFLNPATPGAQLDSQRGSVTTVSLRMAIIADIFFVFCLMGVIAFRSNYGGSIFFMFMIGGCFLVSLYAITALGANYSHCNTQDNIYGNLCSDKRACCVEELRANPANRCPNPLPCTDPEVLMSDLVADPDFLGIFWIHFANWFVFQMPWLIVLLYYWNVKVEPSVAALPPVYEEEPSKDETPLPPPQQPMSSRIFGLRQRIK